MRLQFELDAAARFIASHPHFSHISSFVIEHLLLLSHTVWI